MYRLGILLLIALSTGCASITTGQDQAVSIDTPSCPAVTCRLSNKDGTYFVSNTPGTVMVNRACGPLTIQCTKEGEPDFVMSVGSSVKAMAFGNILFGGLIGAGVDAATGAACEYPNLIPVPMVCGDAASKPTVDFEIPETVAEAATKLGCDTPTFLARGPEGIDVYTANCEESAMLLSCNAEGCSASEYQTGAGN